MKKFFILIFSLLYALPAWAGLGTELRTMAYNLDLKQSPRTQSKLSSLPVINFLARREIGLNHKMFSRTYGICSKDSKKLKKLQYAYRYFPEMCKFDLEKFEFYSKDDLNPNEIEQYTEILILRKKKNPEAMTSLKTKGQINVSLSDSDVTFEKYIHIPEKGISDRPWMTVSIQQTGQGIPNALAELEDGCIIIGYDNGGLMLVEMFTSDTQKLSLEQLLLSVNLMNKISFSDDIIMMHPEWHEIFKTLSESMINEYQHQIRLIKIDSALCKRREFNHSEEDEQQAPRNGYAEFHEDLT